MPQFNVLWPKRRRVAHVYISWIFTDFLLQWSKTFFFREISRTIFVLVMNIWGLAYCTRTCCQIIVWLVILGQRISYLLMTFHIFIANRNSFKMLTCCCVLFFCWNKKPIFLKMESQLAHENNLRKLLGNQHHHLKQHFQR